MADKRFKNQVEAMLKIKERASTKSAFKHLVKLLYIQESPLSRYVYPCTCECVEKCGNPSLAKCEEQLKILGENGFEVVHTANLSETMERLQLELVHLDMNASDALASRQFEFETFRKSVPQLLARPGFKEAGHVFVKWKKRTAGKSKQRKRQKKGAKWSCKTCTFLNDGALGKCEMCSTNKSAM